MNRLFLLLLAGVLMALAPDGPKAAAGSRTDDYDYEPPAPGSYALPVIKPAADGAVLDLEGRSLRLKELTRGRITVLSFIYTRCAAAKACPYATGVLNELHRSSQEDAALAKKMRLVSMSFDPVNDTPERMAAYSAWAQGRTNAAEWHFITTRSQSELQPILAAYGQAVDRKRNPADPTGPLNHSLRVFLIDREGRIRNIYSSGTLDPRLVLADVRTLMMEPARSRPAALTPEEAAGRAGEVCTATFRVGTTVRVTDITARENHRPLEVLLVDAPNDETETTPVERAGIVVSIPAAGLGKFSAPSMEELAQRFEKRTVTVRGLVESEPRPFRHDARGVNLRRARITVLDPGQIQIASRP